jgi:L-asparagine transporter-like permease
VRTPLFPVTTILGGTAVLAIIISTWWVDGMRPTLESGIPWLAFLTVGYAFWARNQRRRVDRGR